MAISEFILAELYGLLRNPAVLKHPLPADEAVEVIQTYRTHPRWRLIGFPTESRPLHDALWQKACTKEFAFRKVYDTRSALTMTAQGVTEIATVNVKDFERLGRLDRNRSRSIQGVCLANFAPISSCSPR